MRTIGIGIGHDDDFIVVNIRNIKICAYACTNRVNHGIDFFILENVSHLGFLSIDDLPSKW